MLNPSTRGRFALKGEHHAPEFIPRIAAKFSAVQRCARRNIAASHEQALSDRMLVLQECTHDLTPNHLDRLTRRRTGLAEPARRR
jgi:hypothetical protein